MTALARTVPDPFDGPNRVLAERLLHHCMVCKLDPLAETFVSALDYLEVLDRAVQPRTYPREMDRVQREAILCSAALGLAELAL